MKFLGFKREKCCDVEEEAEEMLYSCWSENFIFPSKIKTLTFDFF